MAPDPIYLSAPLSLSQGLRVPHPFFSVLPKGRFDERATLLSAAPRLLEQASHAATDRTAVGQGMMAPSPDARSHLTDNLCRF